jgi:hypothetical protein
MAVTEKKVRGQFFKGGFKPIGKIAARLKLVLRHRVRLGSKFPPSLSIKDCPTDCCANENFLFVEPDELMMN